MCKIAAEKMTTEHIEEVVEMEKRCFSDSWTEAMFVNELENEKAYYYVLANGENGKIAGYCGFWKILDEGHIMNVAVDIDCRGKHFSDILMDKMLSEAKKLDISAMTLEVRAGNSAAIGLYRKYGFEMAGIRKSYYEDGENAIVMWLEM